MKHLKLFAEYCEEIAMGLLCATIGAGLFLLAVGFGGAA